MDWCKQTEIIEFIRSQGRLPVDGTDRVLSPEEVLAWFGFDKLLTQREQEEVRKEISEMAEAQAPFDRAALDVEPGRPVGGGHRSQEPNGTY